MKLDKKTVEISHKSKNGIIYSSIMYNNSLDMSDYTLFINFNEQK